MTDLIDEFHAPHFTKGEPTEHHGRLTDWRIEFDDQGTPRSVQLGDINTHGGRHTAENVQTILKREWSNLLVFRHSKDDRITYSFEFVPRDSETTREVIGGKTYSVDPPTE